MDMVTPWIHSNKNYRTDPKFEKYLNFHQYADFFYRFEVSLLTYTWGAETFCVVALLKQ